MLGTYRILYPAASACQRWSRTSPGDVAPDSTTTRSSTTSVPSCPSWVSPSIQSTLTWAKVATAAIVSARGKRVPPVASSWDSVDRSIPTRSANAVRVVPERSMTSSSR